MKSLVKLCVIIAVGISNSSFGSSLDSLVKVENPYLEIITYDSSALLSGASCFPKIMSVRYMELIVELNSYYNNSDSVDVLLIYSDSTQQFIYDLGGYYCVKGVVYDNPVNIYKIHNVEWVNIESSFKSWLELKKIKGIEYLKKMDIDPLYQVPFIAKKCKVQYY